MWQSPDPILDEYMDGKPNGGVFNPKNLGLYSYTANNPINLVDPDGESSKAIARAIPLAGGAAAVDGPFPVGDAIGAMILIAAALASDNDKIDTAVATSSQTKEEDNQFVVRVQVQGKKMKQELHLPIQKKEPVTDKEAKSALGSLKSQLSKSDKKLLGNAFTKAEKWIDSVAESGGIGPLGSKSFTEKGVSPNDARVDIEVLRGPVNLTKEAEGSR